MTPSASPRTLKQRLLAAADTLGLACMLALMLTVFVFDPLARDDIYFMPKFAWIASVGALGLVALLTRMLAGRPAIFHFNEVWIGTLLFAAWHWVAALWARSPSLAFERARQIAWLTLALWLGLQFIRKRRALLWMAWLWIGAGVITALWTLTEDVIHAWFPQHAWIKANLPDWRGYLAAGLGNTNHIGDLLALCLLPTLTLFGEARRRWVKIALFAAAVIIPAGLIVCYSVGSNFGLLAGALAMLVLSVRRDRSRWFARRKIRWIALAAAWAGVVIFFVADHPANPHRPGILKQGFGSDRWKEGGTTRLTIWAGGLEMVRQHPLAGVGTGNFTYVYPEMDSKLIWDRPDLRLYQGMFTNAAHNELLQAWAELGIVGLFLLLTLAGLAYFTLLKNLDWADRPGFLARMTLAGLLTAWLAHAQMNFTLQQPVGALTFYAILLAIALEKRTRPGQPSSPSLTQQFGPLVLRLDAQTMSKPTAIGLAFSVPAGVGAALAALALAGAMAWLPLRWRPVQSQREYNRGRYAAERVGNVQAAETHFKRALELDPYNTNCRSHYSQWLINRGRPAEGLEQLKRVRERLNSPELYMREAQALAALGRQPEAQAAYQTYVKRVWAARQPR